MANQFTIDPPDFERIRKETGPATFDMANLFWLVLNSEASDRRSGVKAAIDRLEKKTLINAPTASQNNFDTQDVTTIRFDGSTAINVTGFQARVEGCIIIVFVIGSATITLKHDSASSEARNRMLFESGGDLAITTNKACILQYQNVRWRELKWA